MSANQLTDTQLVLLSAAAQHPEGAIELASDLQGGTAKKTVGRLLRGGLIEKIPACGALSVDGTAPTDLTVTTLAQRLPYSWTNQERRFRDIGTANS